MLSLVNYSHVHYIMLIIFSIVVLCMSCHAMQLHNTVGLISSLALLYQTPVWRHNKLLRSIVNLNTKSYNELVEVLKSHYDPKPSVIVKRQVQHSRAEVATS